MVLSSFCHTIYRFLPPSVSVAACILKLISTLVLYNHNGKTNDNVNEVLKDLTKLLKQFETKVPFFF